ncbi:MAG: MBL fold metallo-hydrolase [Syntrophomonadaceae bacterium]|nr:MBL fold metallo-hydrolase [Syntrophomonadaceae bacterium]
MQLHILASGSSGNAVFFEFGGTKILVDAGISTRRIERGLAAIGVGAAELDGILITHEHIDHIQGLDVLVRRYKLPVYARPATWSGIACRDKLPGECIKYIEGNFSLGAVEVEPFKISHDAADPLGFCLYYQQQKWVMATDLGVVTREVEQALSHADGAVLESNHDPEMLRTGPYPQMLKQRIRSTQGHLSNYDTAKVLASIPRLESMQVFLAHLSQQNNHPRLAMQTVGEILLKNGCDLKREVVLHPTFPDRTVSFVKK